jgi:signal-transduction protein with cAMP-binding, CBS, and nucleotidyltransferase domain
MDIMLSTKGGDITTWRAAEEFASAYRQALRNRAASDCCGGAEAVFAETCAELESRIAAHQKLLADMNSLIESVATTLSPLQIKEICGRFYNILYHHFEKFRSAPAFYQLSMTFLQEVCSSVVAQTKAQFGQFAAHIPEITLVALGPTGRAEYSSHCRLQLLLIHSEVPEPHKQTIGLFCNALHAAFENAGISIDPEITPCTPEWRGTLAEWQQRCEQWLHSQSDEDLIHLARLADQYPLLSRGQLAGKFKEICSTSLKGNRHALTHLMMRMTSLSNGIGIMGGLKLERSGDDRGLFKLLEHGLLPFSAALSALALITMCEASGNCDRIHDLLKRRKLDVEMAERMLATWHSLQGLRLQREYAFRNGVHPTHALCLDPDDITVDQRHALKKTLEAVAIIQRHVEIIFSGMGE